jgi:hypothetical protein
MHEAGLRMLVGAKKLRRAERLSARYGTTALTASSLLLIST